MRGFLLFLALACPVVLLNPTFWWLVAAKTGAAPTAYGQHDGTVQPALLGPKAPWPEWAIRPEGARLEVQAWFGPGSSQPETGFATIAVGGDPSAGIEAYKRKLEQAGWTVDGQLMRSALPELPPRRLEMCMLRATRADGDPRVLMASIEIAPRPGTGRLHWATRPMAEWKVPNQEPC